jgi:hypothetical protein
MASLQSTSSSGVLKHIGVAAVVAARMHTDYTLVPPPRARKSRLSISDAIQEKGAPHDHLLGEPH